METSRSHPLVVSLSECRNVFHVEYTPHPTLKGLNTHTHTYTHALQTFFILLFIVTQ